jgi:hypothetical protein
VTSNLVFDGIISSSLPSSTEHITLDQFVVALMDELQLNLTKEEAGRLFYNFDREGTGTLSRRAFTTAVRDSIFLRRVVSSLRYPELRNVQVPANYPYTSPTTATHAHPAYIRDSKWNKSTEKVHNPLVHGPLSGELVSVRRTLDYSYHVNYTPERTAWQDELVGNVALRHSPVAWPWLVLTCGAMGAGKGYVLQWLSRTGVFPLDDVVKIDCDHFKAAMPEWRGYVEHDAYTAGTLTHEESGFIQELCEEVSLRDRQNTWIDGSLQNHAWFAAKIKGWRQRYPWYRIAIFYVHAEDEQVLARARLRGQQTGRHVPEQLLRQSIAATAEAADQLGPLADFVARIDNSCATSPHPVLQRFEDRSHSFRVRRPRPLTLMPNSNPTNTSITCPPCHPTLNP